MEEKKHYGAIWLLASFVAGVFTSFSVLVLSLKFGIDIDYPYLMAFGALCAVVILRLGTMYVRKEAIWALSNFLILGGQVIFFAIGAESTFRFLLSIYPPNAY